MGQHKLIKENGNCWNCGIFVVPANRDTCPPWSTTGEGDTDTNRVCEAGELNFLKRLRIRAQELWDASKELDPHETIIIGNSAVILEGLEKLIQKREGLDRS